MVVVDPLTIAKFTLTVIDELIQLGVFTAKLIEDSRNFDNDTRQLHTLIDSDISRTRFLRALLFSETAIYGGQTLFDQFDQDVQEQTEHLLEDSKSTLQQSHDLLVRRHGTKVSRSRTALAPAQSNLSAASTLVAEEQPVRKSSPSIPDLLLWSIRDKKKVEELIKKFNAQNFCIHENVKLWCLANQLGMNIKHLQHMQEDESSRMLGFDIDATLRLVQRDAQDNTESLELKDPAWSEFLQPISPIENQGMFSLITIKGKVFLQENYTVPQRQFSPISLVDNSAKLDGSTRNWVEALAKLLHQPKDQVFRILPCVGWKYLPPFNNIAMVFDASPTSGLPPVSLLHLLYDTSKRPELGDKFRIAVGLSRCIAQLHMVRWFHESFRSDNILLFPHSDPSTKEAHILDFASPWVFGFEFSRPDLFRSRIEPDFLPQRDIYRHPQRQGELQIAFSRIHDIYALGVVLLEIGLWEPAIKLEKNMFARATPEKAASVQLQLIKHAERRLEKHVGKKYKELVVKCLKGNFGVTDDNKEDLKLQQAFRAQVVDVLERSANAV